MKILNSERIRQIVNLARSLEMLINDQRQVFIDFSNGCYQVPDPIQLQFAAAQGDCHVKAGFRRESEFFVVKVVTGFYKNAVMGLPAADGAVLVFSQKTGLLQAILCEKGFLTTLRTAIAAVISASVTPWAVRAVGIIGTGALAALTLFIMKKCYPHADLYLWGRNADKATKMACSHVHRCDSVRELITRSDLVVGTTASMEPVIMAEYLSGNQHIIALGADDAHKQECEPEVLKKADIVLVDSKIQACQSGDTAHALREQVIDSEKIVELGKVLQKPLSPDTRLIVTDLTGIAAQDVAMADFVIRQLGNQGTACVWDDNPPFRCE